MKKKNSHSKRLRNFIKANLSKHVVVFTSSMSHPHYVNRVNPGARTTVARETLAAFDPDSSLYGKIRLDWTVYPVVVLKDAFGNIGKTHVFDTGVAVQNATWKQATEHALLEADEILSEFQHRFRANVGFVFVIDGIPITTNKILECIGQDKNFFTVDESGARDLRTNEEKRQGELELIKKLEVIA